MQGNQFDVRDALNAVSDVIQNRPPPLREFDQIYMKAGDMVMQGEYIAEWSKGKRLAYIGDGDGISACCTYLQKREILRYGPAEVVVFDFDERICNSIRRFADAHDLPLDAMLYNCLDPFPEPDQFDCFYTNPPWGASNNGHSVNVFMQRGFEAVGYDGDGIVVVGDDPTIAWPGEVLASLQGFAISNGYYVQRMMSQAHSYHLDDAPDLKSCNVLLRPCLTEGRTVPASSAITDPERLENFYGRNAAPRVRYVRERERLNYGKAHDSEYKVELLGGNK
jgi:predicted RNA methylase